jgi:hypothetical protein
MKPLRDEYLKAIFKPPKPEEDRRNFFVRLLRSIRVGVSIKRGDDGKIAKSYRIGGGADF